MLKFKGAILKSDIGNFYLQKIVFYLERGILLNAIPLCLDLIFAKQLILMKLILKLVTQLSSLIFQFLFSLFLSTKCQNMLFFAFTMHHCLFLSTQKGFFPYLFIDTHLISGRVLLYTQSQLLGRFRCFPELCRKDPKSCDCFTPGIFLFTLE